MTKTKYKNLDTIVDLLTQQFLIAINHAAVKVDQSEMPYINIFLRKLLRNYRSAYD